MQNNEATLQHITMMLNLVENENSNGRTWSNNKLSTVEHGNSITIKQCNCLKFFEKLLNFSRQIIFILKNFLIITNNKYYVCQKIK